MKKSVLLMAALAAFSISKAQTIVYDADCLDSTLATIYTGPTNQICSSDSSIFELAGYQDVEGIFGDAIWQGNNGYEFNSAVGVLGVNAINVSFFHNCPEAQIFRDENKPTLNNSIVTDFVLIEDCEAAEFLGCTDDNANNFDDRANTDNGSCTYDNDGGDYYATITSDEVITSDDIHAQLINIELDGNQLTSTWIIILPGSSHSVISAYYLSTTTGTVQLDLNLTIDEVSSKDANKPSVQNFTLSKGVDLGKITGLFNQTHHEELSIFPTKVSNEINIQLDGEIDAVTIYNLTGNALINTSSSSIDVSSLPKGNYTIHATSGGVTYSGKFIK